LQLQQTGDWRLFVDMLGLLRSVLVMWTCVPTHNPAMLRTILPAVLPLLQHVQACGPLLPAVPTSTGSNTPGSSSRGSSRQGLLEAFFDLQFNAGLLLSEMCKVLDKEELQGGARQSLLESVHKLLRDPAVLDLQLQLLAVHTSVLHTAHVTHRQQQQRQQQQQQGSSTTPPGGSSSSSAAQAQQQQSLSGPKQQHRADLLPIPAFHQHQDSCSCCQVATPTWLQQQLEL
jgi:hypothetical protein